VARAEANLAALHCLAELEAAGRPAGTAEQAVLARWSGWGAVPEVFDPANERFTGLRAELEAVLGTEGYAAASRNTLNAHYTDASLVAAVWDGLASLGFEGGRVLEPAIF